MRTLLVFMTIFSITANADSPGKLNYICEIQNRPNKAKAEVSIHTDTLFMETHLEEGVVVRGFASETYDPLSQTTSYFLQGSSAPNSQQLQLELKDGGQGAHFTRTYSGATFICSQK